MFETVIHTLQQAVARRGINYSLDRLTDSLLALGNPHTSLPASVHIAGTNGKGSTTTLLSNALMASGLRVGTYTSPHICSYCERIAISGTPISESDFATFYTQVTTQVTSDGLSEFEILTLMAFLYFNHTRPDIIVFETGLGGRLDATNVITPMLSVLTPIGLDHQEILGQGYRAIASEKAGIIKLHTPTVSALQHPDAQHVIRSEAIRHQSPLTWVSPWESIPTHYRLRADYQRQNIAVAHWAAHYVLTALGKSTAAVDDGLAAAFIWGRHSQYHHPNGIVTVDGAHNPHGITALFHENPRPTHLWIGMLKTKSLEETFSLIPSTVKVIYFYCPDSTRWHSADEARLLTQIDIRTENNIDQFPEFNSDLLITGSLYFIATLYPLFDTLELL